MTIQQLLHLQLQVTTYNYNVSQHAGFSLKYLIFLDKHEVEAAGQSEGSASSWHAAARRHDRLQWALFVGRSGFQDQFGGIIELTVFSQAGWRAAYSSPEQAARVVSCDDAGFD